ncbi:MAG: flagellar biosynthesis anti-sigma factor FlgM [Lachnospira sp.]
MVMRVDALNAVSQIYAANSTTAVKKSTQTAQVSDKFEISDMAKTYSTAKAAVKAAPDVRMDKVEDIKARMAAGTYNVSSKDVADKILNSISTMTF